MKRFLNHAGAGSIRVILFLFLVFSCCLGFNPCVSCLSWVLMEYRMLERLKKDAPQLHEDMLAQLHQMQDTVRDTFFECFITLAGKFFLN